MANTKSLGTYVEIIYTNWQHIKWGLTLCRYQYPQTHEGYYKSKQAPHGTVAYSEPLLLSDEVNCLNLGREKQ